MPKPIFTVRKPQRSTQFGRIDVLYQPSLDRQKTKAALAPHLPTIDPHHHLWDYPGYPYLVPEIEAATTASAPSTPNACRCTMRKGSSDSSP